SFFSFHSSAAPPDLPSFPTRRSSDLVRGVGKTTTARILARALNYELADGSIKSPTIAMPALGLHCQAIMESRHVDVIEMDAASRSEEHTSELQSRRDLVCRLLLEKKK